MLKTLRLLLLTAAVAGAVAVGGTTPALACGNNGYSYAGVAAPTYGYGISAVVTPLDAFNVLNGHVAGWVGVGGPGEGPGGTDEWLQVGVSGFPTVVGSDIYYEVALPHRWPTYHQVAANIGDGKAIKVTVLEMHSRPNWWRVWVNHRAVSKPIHLPGSHYLWTPIATAESWDGGTGAVNSFAYRFDIVRVARTSGGVWRSFAGVQRQDAGSRLDMFTKSFVASTPALGNLESGVIVETVATLTAMDNRIDGNRIGTDAEGDGAVPNGSDGVSFTAIRR